MFDLINPYEHFREVKNESINWENCVAYYKLNEIAGNAIDSLNGNNGTVSGATQGLTGVLDKAYGFDGVNDVVTVPDNEVLKGFSNLSISLWIKPDGIATDGIIDKNRDSEWNVHLSNNQVRFQGRNTSNEVIRFTCDVALTSGEWSHVGIVYGSGGDRRIYYNGIEQSVTVNQAAIGVIQSSVNDLLIGKMHDGFFYAGALDEISLFNKSLEGSDFAMLHNLGLGITYLE